MKASGAQGPQDGKAGEAATAPPASASSADPPAPAVSIIAANDDGDEVDDATGGNAGDAHGQSMPDTSASTPGIGGTAPAATSATLTTQSGAQASPLSASTADLAAQMAARVSSGSSQFKLQLNPLGLGQVDVTVSIGADRQLTAALAFADPQTASALSAHASELRTVLEQAGFSVPAGGVDFSAINSPAANPPPVSVDLQGGFSGNGGSGQPGGHTPSSPFGPGEAFLASSPNVAAAAWTSGADSRLDIRI